MRPGSLIFFQRLTLASWAGLAGLLFIWNTFLIDRHLHSLAGSLLIALIPLSIPLRGLLEGRARAFILAALLSLLYFMHGVTEVFEPGDDLAATLEIAFSLSGFIGTTGFAHAVNASRTHG